MYFIPILTMIEDLKKSGLTSAQIADWAKVDRATMCRVEKGQEPSLKFYMCIANLWEIGLQHFIAKVPMSNEELPENERN